MIKKYRKKPVVIEAVQLTEDNGVEIENWIIDNGADATFQWSDGDFWMDIPTLEGMMQASIGDWIIRGVAGEFYPCKPNIFDATYEEVTE